MSRARDVADIMSGAGSNVVFEDGFGLDFGAVSGGGATGSVLDDYEEGTWTPNTVGDATGTLGQVGASYVKIGNIVIARAAIRITNDFTDSFLGGLPFTIDSTNAGPSSLHGVSHVVCGENNITVSGFDDTTNFEFHVNGNTNNTHKPTETGDNYRFQIVYKTA